jgi:hypothetical protein
MWSNIGNYHTQDGFESLSFSYSSSAIKRFPWHPVKQYCFEVLSKQFQILVTPSTDPYAWWYKTWQSAPLYQIPFQNNVWQEKFHSLTYQIMNIFNAPWKKILNVRSPDEYIIKSHRRGFPYGSTVEKNEHYIGFNERDA